MDEKITEKLCYQCHSHPWREPTEIPGPPPARNPGGPNHDLRCSHTGGRTGRLLDRRYGHKGTRDEPRVVQVVVARLTRPKTVADSTQRGRVDWGGRSLGGRYEEGNAQVEKRDEISHPHFGRIFIELGE